MNTRFDVSQTALRPAPAPTDAARGSARPGDAAPAGLNPSPAQDQVQLRSVELAQLAQSSAEMDQAKIERLRDAIGSGQYRVDADAIADRLLQFESDLARDA